MSLVLPFTNSINQSTIKIQTHFSTTFGHWHIIHSTRKKWKANNFFAYLISQAKIRPDQLKHQHFTKWEMRLSPLGCAKDTSCSGIFSALFPFNARRQLPLALASASFRFWAIILSTHNGNNHKRSKTILGLLILVIAVLKMLQLSKLLLSS